jgi:hypothetical protein
MRTDMGRKWIVWAPFAILGILLFVAIGGFVVRELWNWLLPGLFGWPRITFWQAVGLLALCRILFGGSGRYGSSRSRFRGRIRERIAERMAERMGQRWDAMTPEERERFRQGLRTRCDIGPAAGSKDGVTP